MEFGLIGMPLAHSFSAEIHQALGGYAYELHPLQDTELGPFLEQRTFRAVNVTIPYKTAVLPYLDVIDPAARAIGAVNTIVNRNGTLYGYNTDYTGLAHLLQRLDAVPRGAKCLIFGTGGTSRTAQAVLRDAGAKTILRVSRRASGDAIDYAALHAHTDASVLLNTTPVGMFPSADASPVQLNRTTFPALHAAVDVVYNPLRTRFVQSAAAMGARASGGLYMLVWQAAAASELFTGQKTDPTLVDRIYAQQLAARQNIVLIGMPGCGKTTLGKRLAANLGRTFFDTDALLAQKYGITAAEMIRTRGETALRDAESTLLRDTLRQGHHAVIATGGGMVLRPENVALLRENGKLFFLDRPLQALLPTADRPLSANQADLSALYAQRLPIYRRSADRVVSLCGTAQENASLLREAVLEEGDLIL